MFVGDSMLRNTYHQFNALLEPAYKQPNTSFVAAALTSSSSSSSATSRGGRERRSRKAASSSSSSAFSSSSSDLFPFKHSNLQYTHALAAVNVSASFVWAPMVTNITSVLKDGTYTHKDTNK